MPRGDSGKKGEKELSPPSGAVSEIDGNNVYSTAREIDYRRGIPSEFLRVKFANSVRVARINDGSRCRITSMGYAMFIQWNRLGIVGPEHIKRSSATNSRSAKAVETNGGTRLLIN